MSMKTYEEKMVSSDVVAKISKADAELNNGAKLIDGKKALDKLKKKYVK